MTDQLVKLEQRLKLAQQRAERYQRARDTAENLLEQKASELYETNLALQASRDNLQEDIKQATYELQASNSRLQKALDDKSTFIGSISHEVRTPLNAVVGLSELLLESDMTQEQEQYVRTIFESSATLVKLLNDILHISKIEAGKVELHPYPTRIREVLGSLCLMFTTEAANRGVDLSYSVDDGVPTWLQFDEGRVGQIITNLVSNAIKNAEGGAVTIDVSVASRQDDRLTLSFAVQDNGVGIAPEQIKKIFSAYEQFGNLDQGVGLGLAICRHLTYVMQGDLRCDSTPGQGSTFTLDIPVTESSQQEIKQEPEFASYDLSDLRVLIAEDNDVNQHVLRAQFAQLGLAPMIVGDGQQALDALADNIFDIVFLDIQMPVKDGEQTIKEIRAGGRAFATVYCVALTAANFEQRKEQLLALGFSKFLSKPVMLDDLRSTLAESVPTQPEENGLQEGHDDKSDEHNSYFSMDFFQRQFGDHADTVFRQIAPVFLEHAYQQLDQLEQAVQSRTSERIKKLSHSLKGSVASLGLQELGTLFANLEHEPEQSFEGEIFNHAKTLMLRVRAELIDVLEGA